VLVFVVVAVAVFTRNATYTEKMIAVDNLKYVNDLF